MTNLSLVSFKFINVNEFKVHKVDINRKYKIKVLNMKHFHCDKKTTDKKNFSQIYLTYSKKYNYLLKLQQNSNLNIIFSKTTLPELYFNN